MPKPDIRELRVKMKVGPYAGRWVWFSVKRSWDQLYYSFDGNVTWDLSRATAYRLAEAAGQLREAPPPEGS